jgi:hypothetical protein
MEIALIGTWGLLAHHPLFWVPFIGFAYYCWLNAYFYEVSRRLVIRMDLLPHLEMLSMQKIGTFGVTYNKLVKISDLEKLDYDVEKDKGIFFY